VVVDTDDSPQDVMVERVISGLRRHLAEKAGAAAEGSAP